MKNPLNESAGTLKEVIAKYRVWLWQQIQRQGLVYRELLCLAEAARQGDRVLAAPR